MIKKPVLTILFFFSILFIVAQDQTYKRIQIKYDTLVLNSILKLGIPPDNLIDNQWLIFEIPQNELQRLLDAGISYEILIDDLEQFYVERNLGKDPQEIARQFKNNKAYEIPADFSLGSMGGFCTYDELLEHMDNMAATHPGLITAKQTIGTQLTIEGRPIYWIKISDNPGIDEDEPEVLYTGLTHAREPGSMQVLLFYMYYLLENYATNPEIRNLVDNTEMYFVPCANPDGYIYNQTTNPDGGGQWRKNRKNNGGGSFGVDINRNYGYQWGYDNYGSSPVPSSLTYRGTQPFSEPETQIIKTFCEDHDFKIAFNYHTYGNYLLHAWGFTASPLSIDHAYFEAIGKEMSFENNFRVGIPTSILYPVNGECSDWMYGEQTSKPKIFSITPEVGSSTDGFWPNMERIIPQCFETLQQNLTAARLAGPYFLLRDVSPFNITSHHGYFYFEAERLGVGDASFTVSIQALSDHFTSLGSAKTHDGIARLQKVSDSISFALRPGIVPGELIKYVIKIESEIFVKTDTIVKPFGIAELLFSDDCSGMDNWESSKWNITTTSYVSPSTSITDSPENYYSNNETSAITLKNAVSLNGGGSAWVSFNTKWALDGASDYVKCEATSNEGQTWTLLTGEYTLIPAVQGLPSTPIYYGKQTEWVREIIDLTAFCGNSIKLKFTLKTDGATTKDGFYFDDLKIEMIDGNPQYQEFTFTGGWSGISTYLIPENTSFNEIFAGSQNQVIIVQDDNGNSYVPGNPTNTLIQWDLMAGYKIKVTPNAAFSIQGFPETYTQLNLVPGWNLIPVLAQFPVPVSEIQVSPVGSIEVIKEIAGTSIWWPEIGITSLSLLLPGKSYLINSKNNAILEFPVNH